MYKPFSVLVLRLSCLERLRGPFGGVWGNVSQQRISLEMLLIMIMQCFFHFNFSWEFAPVGTKISISPFFSPEQFSLRRNLKSLFLNQNRLTHLPEELCSLARLESLSLSYNFITNLPASFSNLRNLRWKILIFSEENIFSREVKLSSNRIKIFPCELTHLPSLNIVDLSLNQVRKQLIENYIIYVEFYSPFSDCETSWLWTFWNDDDRPQSQWEPDWLSWSRSLEMSTIENSPTPKQQTVPQRHPGKFTGQKLCLYTDGGGKLIWSQGRYLLRNNSKKVSSIPLILSHIQHYLSPWLTFFWVFRKIWIFKY